MTRSQSFHPAADVVAAALDDEAVLLNVSTGVYFGLDEVGTRIWALMTEGADTDAIVEQLAAEFDASHEQLNADVAAFAEQLHAHGLVRA